MEPDAPSAAVAEAMYATLGDDEVVDGALVDVSSKEPLGAAPSSGPIAQYAAYDDLSDDDDASAATDRPLGGGADGAGDGAAYDDVDDFEAPLAVLARGGGGALLATGGSGGAGGSSADVGGATDAAPPCRAALTSEERAWVDELHSAPPRDWNAEFQALLDARPSDAGDVDHDHVDKRGGEVGQASPALVRWLMDMHALVEDFSTCVARIARVVIIEAALGVPREQRAIQATDAGGVAGGEKYVLHGIFVKRVHDARGLYGGEAGAAAAAAHELKGAQAYLHAGQRALRPPLMVLAEFMGMRVLATAVLPISGDTLVYGSADAGRSVQCAPDVAALMAAAGAAIGLKAHVVGATAAAQRSLAAPCDIEVHRGTDGRLYVLDTARVFPPERPEPATELTAVMLDVDVDSPPRPLHLQLSDGWEARVRELLGGDFAVLLLVAQDERDAAAAHRKAARLLVRTGDGDSDDAAPLNARATALTRGRPVRGPALWFRRKHGAHLYELLRGELLRTNDAPLSPDAFTGFGRHCAAVHNAEVAAASARVRTTRPEGPHRRKGGFHRRRDVLDCLVSDIEAGRCSMTNGPVEVARALHSRGLNMRHLGRVRRSLEATLTHDTAALLTEMTARVVKSLLRSRVRHAVHLPGAHAVLPTSTAWAARRAAMDAAFRAAVAAVFALAFGNGPAADHFWRVEVPLALISKYGDPFSVVERKSPFASPHVLDPRAAVHTGHLVLALQDVTGMHLRPSTTERFQKDEALTWTDGGFGVDDVAGYGVVLTSLSYDNKHTFAELHAAGASIEQVCTVFGNDSNEAAVAAVWAAAQLLDAKGDAAGAWELLSTAPECLEQRLLTTDAGAAVLFLRGRCLEALGRNDEAVAEYWRCYDALHLVHGSPQHHSNVVSLKSGDGDGDGEREGKVGETFTYSMVQRGHPFMCVVANRIASIEHATSGGNIDMRTYTTGSAAFQCCAVPDDADTARKFFGAEVPVLLESLAKAQRREAGKELFAEMFETQCRGRSGFLMSETDAMTEVVQDTEEFSITRKNLTTAWRKEVEKLFRLTDQGGGDDEGPPGSTLGILHQLLRPRVVGGVTYEAALAERQRAAVDSAREAAAAAAEASRTAVTISRASHPHLFPPTDSPPGCAPPSPVPGWQPWPVGSFARFACMNVTKTPSGDAPPQRSEVLEVLTAIDVEKRTFTVVVETTTEGMEPRVTATERQFAVEELEETAEGEECVEGLDGVAVRCLRYAYEPPAQSTLVSQKGSMWLPVEEAVGSAEAMLGVPMRCRPITVKMDLRIVTSAVAGTVVGESHCQSISSTTPEVVTLKDGRTVTGHRTDMTTTSGAFVQPTVTKFVYSFGVPGGTVRMSSENVYGVMRLVNNQELVDFGHLSAEETAAIAARVTE